MGKDGHIHRWVGFLLQSKGFRLPGSQTSLWGDTAPQREPQTPGSLSHSWASRDHAYLGKSRSDSLE